MFFARSPWEWVSTTLPVAMEPPWPWPCEVLALQRAEHPFIVHLHRAFLGRKRGKKHAPRWEVFCWKGGIDVLLSCSNLSNKNGVRYVQSLYLHIIYLFIHVSCNAYIYTYMCTSYVHTYILYMQIICMHVNDAILEYII